MRLTTYTSPFAFQRPIRCSVFVRGTRDRRALSCTHSDVVHARLAVNHGSRPHQDGQEGAFTAVDRALARSQPSFPSGATRGRHRTRETARRRERFRGTASPSRGRETRERAGTSSRVIDRIGAVALGGVARSSVPRRASRRARPVAKTFRVLHACERFFLPSIASLVARASRDAHGG